MSWAYQETPGASYSMKWTYWGNNNESSLSTADTLNAGCPIDMHSFELRNSKLKNVTVFLDSLGYLNTCFIYVLGLSRNSWCVIFYEMDILGK